MRVDRATSLGKEASVEECRAEESPAKTRMIPSRTKRTESWLILLFLVSSLSGPLPKASAELFYDSSGADKAYKICSLAGGFHLTRLVSSQTLRLFEDALDDVELLREYISEAATNKGIVGGKHSLEELDQSFDWRARGSSFSGTRDPCTTGGSGRGGKLRRPEHGHTYPKQ